MCSLLPTLIPSNQHLRMAKAEKKPAEKSHRRSSRKFTFSHTTSVWDYQYLQGISDMKSISRKGSSIIDDWDERPHTIEEVKVLLQQRKEAGICTKVMRMLHVINITNIRSVAMEYIYKEPREGHRQGLFQDLYEKAVAQFWISFAEEKVRRAFCLSSFVTVREEFQKATKKVREVFKVLEETIGDKKYFGGEEIGLLDIILGWMAMSFGKGVVKSNV
ncbi:Glutathione transferase GST 23 [Spatholobus suberectus]|nr:Glutathione transferase GST 23 [Spatholobus suberectus]